MKPSPESVLDRAVAVLTACVPGAVIIGGCAVRILREHPLAQKLSHAPLDTTDLDVLLGDTSADVGTEASRRLQEAGFAEELLGSDTPPVVHWSAQARGGRVSVEFLLARASGGGDESESVGRYVGALVAQEMSHLRMLLVAPWAVEATLGGEGGQSMTVAVANPVSLIVQKMFSMRRRRKSAKRAKDLLAVVELVSLFADARNEIAALWVDEVQPSLTQEERAHVRDQARRLSTASSLHELAAAQARAAGWIAPVAADSIAAACREGLAFLAE